MMCIFAVLGILLACILLGPLHAFRHYTPQFRTRQRHAGKPFQIRRSLIKLFQTTLDVTLNTCDDDGRHCTKSEVPPTSSEFGHQDVSYHTEKIALVGELARIYWERVVLYGLWGGGTGLEWTDLIIREPQHFGDHHPNDKEKACLRLAKSRHRTMKPELITPVFHFIQGFGLPEPHIPLSVFEVAYFVRKVLQFKFKPNDPHKKLAKTLCEVLQINIELERLPPYSSMHKYLTDAYDKATAANDMYAEFTKRRRAELAVPRAEKVFDTFEYAPKQYK